jgi:simple sugar transport system permease protein
VAVPFRAGLFNLGGEGQLLLGALIAVEVAVSFPGGGGTPVSFVVPLLAGAVAGSVVAAVPALLKARRGVSEIVTTIMLNFIVTFLVQYLVRGPFEGANAVYPTTDVVPSGLRLGHYGPSALVPMGFMVAVVVALAVWTLTELTRLGWRQRLVGLNRLVAARQGISVPREWIVALALGGALAGLGGAAEALGNQLQVGYSFSPGWGWDAVSIALLARGNALAVVPFALYFAFLRNGALVLQQDLQVSSDLILAMGGAPVMLVASIIGFRAYRRFVAQPVPD